MLNLQGDVVRIVTNKGVTRVTYEYDAWGNITNMTYTNKTLADANPLRYRGYYYDRETGLYYLQSRYYNPKWGRFLNADSYISTGQGIIGNNMFAYCLNNPVNYIDRDGANAEAIQWWTAGMVWLPFADTVLPVGDIIYFGGLLILGGVTLSTDQYYIPEISYDEAEVVYSPPPTNNDDDEFDDDDLDDDYYNDDHNFGGRQKIGKPKGKTPGNNQAQNKQFNDATKDILNKDQQQKLHKELSKEGFGFHDIVDAAKNFWFVFLGLFGIDDQ